MNAEEQKAYDLVVENHERAMNRVASLERELAALRAVPNEVEVVGWLGGNGLRNNFESATGSPFALMTVTQHNAIAASLSPENQRTVPAPPLIADRHPMDVRQPVTDNQQAEREAFELECKRLGLSLIRRGQSGRYSPEIQCAWMLWQARAALSAPSVGQDVSALVERLQMQLVACGVVALANTPESAARARDMHPDYMSASCSDVMRAVDREMHQRADLLDWAVECWHAEVSQRPLVNVNRRSIDDTWRQIIRKLGGDPVDLCGPDHDTLLASAEGVKNENV